MRLLLQDASFVQPGCGTAGGNGGVHSQANISETTVVSTDIQHSNICLQPGRHHGLIEPQPPGDRCSAPPLTEVRVEVEQLSFWLTHARMKRLTPRRRGEHGCCCWRCLACAGSSPQARGALVPHLQRPCADGLIPAGAGSTSPGTPGPPHARAHPRRRGEHPSGVAVLTPGLGSSPQARGARSGPGPRWSWRRLIPAGAGSTPATGSPDGGSGAHPRRRGEHLTVGRYLYPMNGSSPQARGALRAVRSLGPRTGLIPAGAGSTTPPVSWPWKRTAHPRRRGEHGHAHVTVQQRAGSSPQARGALTGRVRVHGQ